jgi:hypothetical protein
MTKQTVPVALGNINGVAVALAYALVNSCLALLLAFGLKLTQDESAGILAFVNNALVLVAYISHNGAKRSQTVIPARPVDQSGGGEA